MKALLVRLISLEAEASGSIFFPHSLPSTFEGLRAPFKRQEAETVLRKLARKGFSSVSLLAIRCFHPFTLQRIHPPFIYLFFFRANFANVRAASITLIVRASSFSLWQINFDSSPELIQKRIVLCNYDVEPATIALFKLNFVHYPGLYIFSD